MKKLFVLLLCLLINMPVYAEQLALRVGFVLPLSGEWASLGNGIRDGALLAQSDLAKQGQKIELEFEDNGGDLAPSAQIGSKLITLEKVDALVSIISGVGRIMKSLANQAKILHIGICSEPEVADGEYSFINYLTAEQGVTKYIEYFRAQYGDNKSLAIFSMNESGFQRIVSEFLRKSDHTIKVLSSESFDKGTTDFRTILLRSMGKRPDVVLLLGLSPEIETLARQYRSLHFEVPLSSIEGIGLASDKSPFEGSWFVDSAVPHKPFRERFVATYGREVTPGVGHAYDSVKLLAHAFAGATGKEDAALKFRHIADFSGVIGTLDMQPGGIIWSDASIKRILNGKPELVEDR